MALPDRDRTEVAARPTVERDLLGIFAEAKSLLDAGPRIVEAIAAALGWEAAAMWEVEDGGGHLRCIATWLAPDLEGSGFDVQTRQIRFARGVGLPGRVWESARPEWVTDVLEHPNFPRAELARAAGLHTGFALPIDSHDSVIGVIEAYTRETLEPDVMLLDSMGSLGVVIGQYVRRTAAEEGLRASEALKTAMLTSALDAVIAIDADGRILEFNPAAERTFGYTRDDALGREMAELIIPPSLRERHRRGLTRYRTTGQGVLLNRRSELRGMRADGSEFPIELTITRVGDGEPQTFAGFLRDISARKRSEESLLFLAEAGAILDSSLDLDTTLKNVARLCVPILGDGCMVDLIDEGGELRRTGSATADDSIQPVLEDLRRHRIDPAGPHPIARALRSGQTEIVQRFTDSLLQEIAEGDADYLAALRRWPAQAAVVAPLKARGKLLGAIALAAFDPERRFGQTEIALIEETAKRAAVAVDNARLYSERSALLEKLDERPR
jgi:PAS domain S-box-containing protein